MTNSQPVNISVVLKLVHRGEHVSRYSADSRKVAVNTVYVTNVSLPDTPPDRVQLQLSSIPD